MSSQLPPVAPEKKSDARPTYRFECGCEFPILKPADSEDVIPLIDIDTENLPLDCSATWRMLSEGKTRGVFQLEKQLGQEWSRKLKPESIEHLSALGALLRPGALNARDEHGISSTAHYCLRKNGEEEVDSLHPSLDRILAKTYSTVVYQEDFLRISRELAGFDLMAAHRLMKGVAKKEYAILAAIKKEFLEGCAKVGSLSTDTAEMVWSWIEAAGRYAFNKCLNGNELLPRIPGGRFKSEPLTIEEAYFIRNDIAYAKRNGRLALYKKWKFHGDYGAAHSMCPDGRIRPNRIVDIRPAGIRITYRVVVEGGHSVSVTDNHKFPTPSGERTTAELRVGDELYLCGTFDKTRKRYAHSHMTAEDIRRRDSGHVNGATGENNYGFTGGGWTKLQQAKATLPKVCCDCGKTTTLELHHCNGDPTDNVLTNLRYLCSSCHKKTEYKAGRTRKGEKGYPSEIVRVVDIVEESPAQTYDLEMAAPHHNFVTAGGIVVCNSHSTAYAMLGYTTAYLKCHFSVQFYAACLRVGCDDMDDVAVLVNDAREFGVDVRGPHFAHRDIHCHTDGRAVYYGVCDIKGVGENAGRAFLDVNQAAPHSVGKPLAELTWFEYLLHVLGRIEKPVLYIRSGALDSFKIPRARMLAELDAWKALTDSEREWVLTAHRFQLDPPDAEGVRENLANLEFRLKELDPKSAADRDEVADLKESIHLDKLRIHFLEHGLAPFDSLEGALDSLGLPRQPPKPKTKAEAKKPQPTGPFGGCSKEDRREIVLSLAQQLRKPPTPLVDSPRQVAMEEEDLLGLPISCYRLDQCDLSEANTTIQRVKEGEVPRRILLGIEVIDVRLNTTKKGRTPGSEMAHLTILDRTGSMQATVFPEAWAKIRGMAGVGSLLLLHVERDKKNDLSVIVLDAWRPKSSAPAQSS